MKFKSSANDKVEKNVQNIGNGPFRRQKDYAEERHGKKK